MYVFGLFASIRYLHKFGLDNFVVKCSKRHLLRRYRDPDYYSLYNFFSCRMILVLSIQKHSRTMGMNEILYGSGDRFANEYSPLSSCHLSYKSSWFWSSFTLFHFWVIWKTSYIFTNGNNKGGNGSSNLVINHEKKVHLYIVIENRL